MFMMPFQHLTAMQLRRYEILVLSVEHQGEIVPYLDELPTQTRRMAREPVNETWSKRTSHR